MFQSTLSSAGLELARQQLHEPADPVERQRALAELRAWVLSHPHLHARTDDWHLVFFLRGCKYNQDRARRKIMSYYEMRSEVPEWFQQRDPAHQSIMDLLKLGVFLPLLNKDEEGRMIVLIRAAAHDPCQHSQSNVFKTGKMLVDLLMEVDENLAVFGVVAILDLNGVTLGHAMQLTPAIIKKAVHAWQDCYPVRTKSMDVVNAPTYVNVVLNIFRNFMNEKLKSRVHVHGKGLASLHKIVSPSILPKEYGGSSGTLQELIDYWTEQAMGRRQWFLENEKHRAELPHAK